MGAAVEIGEGVSSTKQRVVADKAEIPRVAATIWPWREEPVVLKNTPLRPGWGSGMERINGLGERNAHWWTERISLG